MAGWDWCQTTNLDRPPLPEGFRSPVGELNPLSVPPAHMRQSVHDQLNEVNAGGDLSARPTGPVPERVLGYRAVLAKVNHALRSRIRRHARPRSRERVLGSDSLRKPSRGVGRRRLRTARFPELPRLHGRTARLQVESDPAAGTATTPERWGCPSRH